MGLLPKLKTKTSVEDYLEGEKFSPVKHEYIEGEVYAMAGTSNNHSRISVNLTTALSNHLRDSACEPFAGETKVRAAINIFYTPLSISTASISSFIAARRTAPG